MNTKLHEMHSLFDMGRFPWLVHLGASLNIVFTVWLTRIVYVQFEGALFALLPFAIFIIALNLLPVIVLRMLDERDVSTVTPEQMNFFRDQHMFPSWVYAIASANMLFWILFAWSVLSYSQGLVTLYMLQFVAFLITYVPLWRWFYRRLCSPLV